MPLSERQRNQRNAYNNLLWFRTKSDNAIAIAIINAVHDMTISVENFQLIFNGYLFEALGLRPKNIRTFEGLKGLIRKTYGQLLGFNRLTEEERRTLEVITIAYKEGRNINEQDDISLENLNLNQFPQNTDIFFNGRVIYSTLIEGYQLFAVLSISQFINLKIIGIGSFSNFVDDRLFPSEEMLEEFGSIEGYYNSVFIDSFINGLSEDNDRNSVLKRFLNQMQQSLRWNPQRDNRPSICQNKSRLACFTSQQSLMLNYFEKSGTLYRDNLINLINFQTSNIKNITETILHEILTNIRRPGSNDINIRELAFKITFKIPFSGV